MGLEGLVANRNSSDSGVTSLKGSRVRKRSANLRNIAAYASLFLAALGAGHHTPAFAQETYSPAANELRIKREAKCEELQSRITPQEETDPLIQKVAEYLDARYKAKDKPRMLASMAKIMKEGVGIQDVWAEYKLNSHIIQKGFFITYNVHNDIPVVNLYKIHKADCFKGFYDISGEWRNDVFGFEFMPYPRVLLGEKIFTNREEVPDFSTFYKVDGIGTVIAIPYLRIMEGLSGFPRAYSDAETEFMTMYELGLALFRTGFEKVGAIVANGYQLERGIDVNSPEDIARHLSNRNLRKTDIGDFYLNKLLLPGKSGFQQFDQAASSLGRDVASVTEKVSEYNPKYNINGPKNPFEMPVDQRLLTMRLLFNNWKGIFNQYPPRN